MLEPLGNLIRRWNADPRPATTLALCQALAEAGEQQRAAPPPDWPQFVQVCADVGRIVGDRFALDLDVLLAAGRMHLAAGATWDAQSVMLQAAKIAPDEPRSWVLLGEALLRRGDAQRATRSFDRASAAGVRVDPLLAELARVLAAGPPATREAIAEVVAQQLGYAAIPPPAGMPSMAAPPMSTPAPGPGVPRSASTPRMAAVPAMAAPRLPQLNPPDRDEDAGEMTARHEFDREELMALLRASEGGGGRLSLDEESLTRERPAARPMPPRAPVNSDAFTLIRGAVEDDTTTDSEDIPTSIGQVPRELLESIQLGRPDPAAGRPPSASFGESAPTLARQLAPRSPNVQYHAPPEDEPTSEQGRGLADDESSEGDTLELRRAGILALPRARLPEPAPAARVIVEPPPRAHRPPEPVAIPRAVPVPPPTPRDPVVLPGLVDDASMSGERPVPSGPDGGGAAIDPAPGERKKPRRRVLGWLLAGVALAAAGGGGAHLWRQRRAAGDVGEARDAARRSGEALDAGDLRASQQLADRAVELAPRDPDAVRAAVEARVVGVLDGATTADAAVDVLTTARRLGADGVALAAAALAAAVGARNGAHARSLLEQHRRDGVDRSDAIYLLAEGAALDLLADPAAIDAYAKARELRPALGSAVVRQVRALILAGRVGEARAAAGGVELPKPVAGALEVLLARGAQPDRWPEKEARIAREDVGDLPRPLRTIGAALALVPPESQGGQEMGLDAALDDADTPGALLLAGQLALAAKDLEGALGAAKRAIAMEPGWTPAHALSARVLLLRGQLAEALALEASLPPAVALEVKAIAAYESGDAEALAEAESKAVEKGVARWPALALALARLRSGAKRPKPAESEGLLAEGVIWADVLAVDLAIDAGELDRAKVVVGGWGPSPDPSRALRVARLRRITGDLGGAATAVKAAGDGRWAKIEGLLLAAETRAERKAAIARLEKTPDPALAELSPFALAYLRAREGAFQGAAAALTKVKVPKGGPLEGRVVALLGLAGARDTPGAKPLVELIDAMKGRPEVVWAGVMLGELPPSRMPKSMK